MEYSEEELEQMMQEYKALSQEMKELKDKQDSIKETISEALDLSSETTIQLNSFKASKVIRKGSVKTKLIQAKYNISDEDLDTHYRNTPTTYWTFKETN